VTVTLNWQLEFVAIAAPLNAMLVGAVVVNVPPQTVAVALATVRPLGSVSLKATPVSATGLAAGLVIVNVNAVVAFSPISDGLNTFAIDGGAALVKEAVAVNPVKLSLAVTAPVVFT
jgi:hypothetical protein